MSEDKTNVLFLVPTLRRAGAETQAIALANGLDASAFGKVLVTFSGRPDQADKLDNQSVTFLEVTRCRKWDLGLPRRLAKVINDYEIDVIHCTSQISALLGILARKYACRKNRVVATLHTTVNRSAKEEFYDLVLYRRILRACDKIIYVCYRQREHWEARFPELAEKGVVVYNGVDVEAYQREAFEQDGNALRDRLGIPQQAPVVICVAGFRPEKGHDHLLRAFRELSPEVRLLLAGDGPGREATEAFARSEGVADRVHFLGDVGDVRPVLAASDLLVIASTAVETFSMAVLEGMAMGLPAVVTDVGGLREAVVSGETGWVVAVGSETALSWGIAEVVADRQKLATMGAAARERVVDLFTAQKMVADTARVFEQAVGS